MDDNRLLNLDLIKILDLAVVMTDQDTVSYISPFACELLMIDPSESLQGLSFSELFVAEDPRHPIDHILSLEENVWLSAVKTLRKSTKGNQQLFLRGMLLDKGRDRAIYSLDYAGFNPRRKHMDIMTTVVESSPVAIMVTDLRGVILYVNDKFKELTGYDKDEVLGLRPSMLKSGTHSKPFYDDLWRTIRSGVIWKGILYNKRKDGTLFWEETTIQPLNGNSGRIEYFLAFKKDITERKQLEEQLHQKNTSLEEAVQLLKETQAQMIQQEKMASVGQLAAGVAHEINNPLGFITSNVNTLSDYIVKFKRYMASLEDMILSTDAAEASDKVILLNKLQKHDQVKLISEDVDELIKDVETGLERVRKIVQGLRDFSRIDQMSELADYDLNEGIATTLLVAQNEIKYVAEVKCNFAPQMPMIIANGGQINQVILNLLLNAVQAIDEKDDKSILGTIEIETHCDPSYVTLIVRDDGPGMSEETLRRLFEPFYTTKPPGLGTGLGLSICYDIVVNKHRGFLKASNNSDKGCSMILSLPIQTV